MSESSSSSVSSLPSSSNAPLKKRLLGQHSNAPKNDEKHAAAAALAALSGVGDDASDGKTAPEVGPGDANGKTIEKGTESPVTPADRHLTARPKLVHAPPVNKMMVDHTYSDYSVFDEEVLAMLEKNSEASEFLSKDTSLSTAEKQERVKSLDQLKKIFGDAPTRKNSGGVVQPFPEKLMEVLDRGDMDEIVRWMPHGRAFMVLQPQAFVKEVLPRFFKQSKFMSFTRQLNLWGFKRITKGTDSGAYYHELFLRGRPRLCMKMRRQKIKGTGIKLTPNPESEPDFYKISKDSPLPPVNVKKLKPLPPLPSAAVLPQPTFSSPSSLMRPDPQMSKPSHILPVDAILGNRITDHAVPSHRTSSVQDRPNFAYSQLPPLEQHSLARNHMADEIPPPPPLPTSVPTARPRAYLGQETLSPPPSARGLNASRMISYPGEQAQSRPGMYTSFSESRVPPASTESHIAAAIRERAAVAEQERAVLRAKELLFQLENRGPSDVPVNASIDELKHQLLEAANNLGHNPRPPASNSARFVQEQGAPPYFENSSYTSPGQVPYRGSDITASALMSALEHTQQVAAAAQQQSQILQQFAFGLASAPSNNVQQQQPGHGSHFHNANRHPY